MQFLKIPMNQTSWIVTKKKIIGYLKILAMILLGVDHF